ncbi:MAG: hypothetical protein JWP01_413 [Myxococcales bacterium]|nr:hypothetical protein [Myxococcales bacterium]
MAEVRAPDRGVGGTAIRQCSPRGVSGSRRWLRWMPLRALDRRHRERQRGPRRVYQPDGRSAGNGPARRAGCPHLPRRGQRWGCALASRRRRRGRGAAFECQRGGERSSARADPLRHGGHHGSRGVGRTDQRAPGARRLADLGTAGLSCGCRALVSSRCAGARACRGPRLLAACATDRAFGECFAGIYRALGRHVHAEIVLRTY